MLSAEEAAHSDEEVQTPLTEEQTEFLIWLVESRSSMVRGRGLTHEIKGGVKTGPIPKSTRVDKCDL